MAQEFNLDQVLQGQAGLFQDPLQQRYANTNAVYSRANAIVNDFVLNKDLPNWINNYSKQTGQRPTANQIAKAQAMFVEQRKPMALQVLSQKATAQGAKLISPETYQLNTQPKTQNPVANALSALKTGVLGVNPTAQQQLGGDPTANFVASTIGSALRGAGVSFPAGVLGEIVGGPGGAITASSLASGGDSAFQNIQAQKQAVYQGKQPNIDPNSAIAQGTFDALPWQKLKPFNNLSTPVEILAEGGQEALSQIAGNITNRYNDNALEGTGESFAGGIGVGAGMAFAKALMGRFGRNIRTPENYTPEQETAILGTAVEQLAQLGVSPESDAIYNELRQRYGDDIATIAVNQASSMYNATHGVQPQFQEGQEMGNALVDPKTRIYQGGVTALQEAPIETATPTFPQGEAPSTTLNALASIPNAMDSIATALQPTQATLLKPQSVTVPQGNPSTSIPPVIGDVSQQQTQEVPQLPQTVDPQQQLIQQLQALPMQEQQAILSQLLQLSQQQTPQTQQTAELPQIAPTSTLPPQQTEALQGQQIAPNPEPQTPPARLNTPQVQRPKDETTQGFKGAIQQTFGLNDEQADAVAQVYEATNRTIAERNAITPQEQAQRFEFTKATPEQLQGKELKQEQGESNQTNTPEFKKWFDASQVVDEQGKPLVVYHGTDANFNIFDNTKGLNKRVNTPGYFFTDNEKIAKDYGEKQKKTFLKMEDPVSFDFDGSSTVFFDKKWRTPSDLVNRIAEIRDDIKNHYELSDDLKDELEQAGWESTSQIDIDGLILKNINDNASSFDDTTSNQYVVFDSTQIKSATENKGTFDPSNPDIRFQTKGKELKQEQARKPIGYATLGSNKKYDKIEFTSEPINETSFPFYDTDLKSNAKELAQSLATQWNYDPKDYQVIDPANNELRGYEFSALPEFLNKGKPFTVKHKRIKATQPLVVAENKPAEITSLDKQAFSKALAPYQEKIKKFPKSDRYITTVNALSSQGRENRVVPVEIEIYQQGLDDLLDNYGVSSTEKLYEEYPEAIEQLDNLGQFKAKDLYDDKQSEFEASEEEAVSSLLTHMGLEQKEGLITNDEIARKLEKVFNTEVKQSALSDSQYLELMVNDEDSITIGVRNHTASSQKPVDYLIDTEGGITETEVDDLISTIKKDLNNNYNLRFQQALSEPLGAFQQKDQQLIIYGLTNPNVSTPLHELAHAYESVLNPIERKMVLQYAGQKKWNRATSEAFAEGFEAYLAEGNAPTKGLKGVFKKFKTWLTNIYKAIEGSPLERELSPAMREIYDVMLGGKPKDKAKTAKVYDNDGNAYEVRYKVVEASQLVTSNNDDLTPNKAYPQELQPRDRERATSREQINDIAQALTPEKLTDSKSITDGSPIVGKDNVVESGNGRTLAIRQAYKLFKDKGKEYKAYLEANASEFGLDPEVIKGMKQPVLVRERLTDTDRVAFTKKANESTIASLSILEQAKNDADKVSVETLNLLQPDEKGRLNGEFVQAFTLEVVPNNEHATMVNKQSQLTATGLKRIQNALLVKAFPNANNLTTLLDNAEEESVNLGKAMFAISPTVAEYKAQQEAKVYKDFDISSDIGMAVEKLLELKEKGITVKDYRRQLSLLGDGLSPEANKVLNLIVEYANKPKQLTNLLKHYYQLAKQEGNPEQMSILPDRSKLELLEDAEVYALTDQLAGMSKTDILKLKEKLSDAQFQQIERMVNCG